MTIFTTHNNGAFSMSNIDNNISNDDDCYDDDDDDEQKTSYEIWKQIKVNENQI